MLTTDRNKHLTVLEVITPDRPGLLARIGRIFYRFGIQLQNAKITTLGERVEDVFFITDHQQRPIEDPELCVAIQAAIKKELDERGRRLSICADTCMNPDLDKLQPYPFEKLAALKAGVTPPALRAYRAVDWRTETPAPDFVRSALSDNLAQLSNVSRAAKASELREAIAAWATRRFQLRTLDAETQVLPGVRWYARSTVRIRPDTSIDRADPLVIAPNPFYQIYEGAAYLPAPNRISSTAPRTIISSPISTPFPQRCGSAANCCFCAAPATRPARYSIAPRWKIDRAGRSLRLRYRQRRMLFGNLFRRSQPAARFIAGLRANRPRRLSPLRGISQPVETLQRAGTALGLCRGRRRHTEKVSAVPHLSRLRAAGAYAARAASPRGTTNSMCRTIESCIEEIRYRPRHSRRRARCQEARCGVLFVGRHANG